jgi:hypothetical protein
MVTGAVPVFVIELFAFDQRWDTVAVERREAAGVVCGVQMVGEALR